MAAAGKIAKLPHMAKSLITVIGSTNVDMIAQMEHIPAVGETVTGGRFMQTFGGKGANQAVAAARAGGEVRFITCLGEDGFAPQNLENFRRDQILVDGVIIRPQTHTGVALIMFDAQGRNCIAVASGANFALTAADMDQRRELIAASKLLVMQNEIAPVAAIRAIDIAHAAGVPVLLNYAPVSGTPIALSSKIRWLIANETEASQLTGLEVQTSAQVAAAALRLQQMGPATVIITLGAQGSYVLDGKQSYSVPPFMVKAVDTTAAGDTYCGALAVALVENLPLQAAVRFATAASAISVTRMGAQPSIPQRAEINALLA